MRSPLLCVLFLLAGCESNFVPRTLVDDYRVFGVVTEPPATDPYSTVELTVKDTGQTGVTYEWTLCPVAIGALLNFACLAPELEEVFVTDTPRLTVDFGPAGIDLLGTLVEWFSAQSEGGECDADCMALAMDRVLDVQFTVESKQGEEVLFTTVRTVRVQADGQALNTNPVIESLAVDGVAEGDPVAPGAELIVRVDLAPESLQTFARANGEMETEEGQVSWYATAGEFDATFTFGTAHENRLVLPNDLEGEGIRLFVGARDGRGGFAFVERTLPLAP